jgi:signal transduction histidine kinase
MYGIIKRSKLLTTVVLIFLAGYFLEVAIDKSGAPPFVKNTLEIISELFAVFVALSIFSITWNAYGKSKDNHSLLLGSSFFVIGILILFHMLSYPFMPQFFTPNSTHKDAYFLVESRLVLAIMLLASVYVYKDTLPKLINKNLMVILAIGFSILSFAFVLFYHDYVLSSFRPDDTSSIEMIFLLIFITVVALLASHLYARRVKETGQTNLNSLIDGSIIIVLSNIIYFYYEFSGHFLIITGFYFVYRSLYTSSVELPYEKLAEAEEKLRLAAEDRYKNLVDNACDAIITTDLEDRVTSWNRSAEKIFGWESHEATGKKLFPLIVLSGSRPETECMHKDGTKINVSLITSPLMDANKDKIGLSFVIRDITNQKLAEQIFLENQALILASKTKSEFLSTMSHELRTPLNAIIGFSQLMKRNTHGKLNERQEYYVSNIHTSGENLLRIINDILEFSQLEAGKMDPVIEKFSLPEAINSVLELIKEKTIMQNVLLKTELDPELEFIEADREKFNQVLFNLVVNGIKFSKNTGGTVRIITKKEGDMAKFQVSDTGIGIKEEDLKKLFKAFEQLNSEITKNYGGTGLGLAISKKLVELHGGRIKAESKYGEGSTFTVFLPITQIRRSDVEQ